MRLAHRVFASSCLLGAVLASGCSGDEPVVCEGAACNPPPTGTFFSFDLETVTLYAGTTTDVTIGVRGGTAAPPPNKRLSIVAVDLPPNVTASPADFTNPQVKIRLTALPGAKHVGTRVRFVFKDEDANITNDRTATIFVRDKAGAIDNSFGDDGRVEIPPGVGGTSLSGIAVASDAIVVAGSSEKNFVVSRVRIDNGKLDTEFGTNGTAVGNHRSEENSDEIAETLVLGPKGQAYVGGYGIPASAGSEYQLARFDSKGALDPTFNQTGFFASRYTGNSVPPDKIVELSLRGAVVQPKDGKIVFTGTAVENLGYPILVSHAVMARLGEDGKLDASFGGGDGWTDRVVATNDSEVCNAVMVASFGDRLYCAGSRQPANGTTPKSFFVWRVNPDGSNDNAFGIGGVAKMAYPADVVRGEIFGIHDVATGPVVVGISDGKAVVLHIDLVDGLGDPKFNGGAPIALDAFGPVAEGTALRSVASADGTITVVTTTGVNNDIAISRVLPDGKIDAKLGEAGGITVKLPSKGVSGRARIALQPDGRVVVGTSMDGKGIVLYRLWGN